MRLYEEFTHTIEIEKSRFICILSRVFSEAEAREKIQSIRKAMPDATHHCTAFVIGENNELHVPMMMVNHQEPQGYRCWKH